MSFICMRMKNDFRIKGWASTLVLKQRPGRTRKWRIDLDCFPYRAFSLTWPASMQIYWNKRKRLHKKRVHLSQDWFGTPTWPPFHCWGNKPMRFLDCLRLRHVNLLPYLIGSSEIRFLLLVVIVIMISVELLSSLLFWKMAVDVSLIWDRRVGFITVKRTFVNGLSKTNSKSNKIILS